MENNKRFGMAGFALRSLLIAISAALIVVLIGSGLLLLVAKVTNGDQTLSDAEQVDALAQIDAYSAEVEAGKPSREKTEFIAVVLVVLGDGAITKNEIKEVKQLYDQAVSQNPS